MKPSHLFKPPGFVLFFIWVATIGLAPGIAQDIQTPGKRELPNSASSAVAPTINVTDQRASLERSQQLRLSKQLALAGGNRKQLEQAIRLATPQQVKAVKFLIEHMPKRDLESLSSDFILENVRLAYLAKSQVPWGAELPEDVFFNDVLPYANVDETREPWRAAMMQRCLPLVRKCKTCSEAAQILNQQLFPLIKVRYSTKRKKANQSPSESIEQGLASCTGLSILLTNACRSVGVPARLAGIPSWVNKRGNHTWVEVWDQDGWHFTGAAEYDTQGLDRAWFTGDAALADKSKPRNSVYAISFARTETPFPMVWSDDPNDVVHAVNVTDRYARPVKPKIGPQETRVRVRVWNLARTQRLARQVTVIEVRKLDAQQPEQQTLAESSMVGTSKPSSADMNDMLEFTLRRGATYRIQVKGSSRLVVQRLKTDSQQATQLVEMVAD